MYKKIPSSKKRDRNDHNHLSFSHCLVGKVCVCVHVLGNMSINGEKTVGKIAPIRFEMSSPVSSEDVVWVFLTFRSRLSRVLALNSVL